jgi:hypothetical protein
LREARPEGLAADASDEGAVPDEFVKQFAQRFGFEAPQSQNAFLRAMDVFVGQVHQLE